MGEERARVEEEGVRWRGEGEPGRGREREGEGAEKMGDKRGGAASASPSCWRFQALQQVYPAGASTRAPECQGESATRPAGGSSMRW